MVEKAAKSSVGAKAFGVLALAVVIGAGYVGFVKLSEGHDRAQAETRAVVIELKNDTLKELRASSQNTVTEIRRLADGAALGGGSSGLETVSEITSELKQLRAELRALREEHKKPAVLSGTGAEPHKPAEQTRVVTRLVRPSTWTVYFPLNKVMTAGVDEQVAKAVVDMNRKKGDQTCRLSVHGYSDTLGGDKRNLELSRQRAEYVARKLRFEEFIVMEVRAWGERRLETHTLDGVDNKKNRRVEITMACEAKASPLPEPKAGNTS